MSQKTTDHLLQFKEGMDLDRLIRLKEVMALTGLSRTTIWRLEKDLQFPKRCQISPNAIGWRSSAIAEWIDSRQDAA